MIHLFAEWLRAELRERDWDHAALPLARVLRLRLGALLPTRPASDPALDGLVAEADMRRDAE